MNRISDCLKASGGISSQLTVTVVPLVRPVKSKVLPAGTVMPLRTMLVQDVLLAEAEAAELKVQVEALLLVVLVDLLLGAAATRALEPSRARAAAERILEIDGVW